MIEAYFATTEDLPDPLGREDLLLRLPFARREGIARAVRAETRIERLGAGLLLEAVFSAHGLKSDEIFFGERGKPLHPKAFFSLSHGGGGVALALSERGAVGCDLERARPLPPHAERVLSEEEREALANRPEDAREREFFRLWTKKESFLKFTGEGLRKIRETALKEEGDLLSRGETRCRFRTYEIGAFVLSVCAEEEDFPAEVKKLRIR